MRGIYWSLMESPHKWLVMWGFYIFSLINMINLLSKRLSSWWVEMPWHTIVMLNCVCNWLFNTLRPRQNGRHFADDIFNCVFLNENVWIPIKISLKFVPKGPIHHIPALVQIMAWCRPGDKPLSEPTMLSLPTRICVFRPQWVNGKYCSFLRKDLL